MSTVTVRCACGDVFEISVRSYRRHRAQGSMWRCTICMRPAAKIVVTDRYRNYWKKRFSDEWIRETGQMIWGPPD
jgi:hypothetical protein